MIENDIVIEDLEQDQNLLKLTELPDEIILRIYSYLTTSETLNTMALKSFVNVRDAQPAKLKFCL